MWGVLEVLEADPDGLETAAGHITNLLTDLDTGALAAVTPNAEVYGHAGLASKLAEFAGLARIAARVLHERVDLTGSALQDAATVYRGMELGNETLIRQAGQ
ncbi:hypothetical protein [Amycolatopsis viridis]|uniref:ESX-1 secretion-associated protein n=1 Tax=Amycolatopsis viridis TaxID=185678 RepID=A0ABX0SP87_9PSEU|nr:hypothetical protein [Amycolatopsis viridis]NIH77737.1 hypothetical protein [Amycolatopsis viridis]